MKSEWKQDFNQDLLVRWTEPTENKKSANKKQEDDQETAKRPKLRSDGLEGSSFVKDLKKKKWAKPIVSVWIQNEAPKKRR